MCEICEWSNCPPACPTYAGNWEGSGTRAGRCTLCGSVLHTGERALLKAGKLLCTDCAAELDTDDLLALTGAADTAALLCEELGWESIVL